VILIMILTTNNMSIKTDAQLKTELDTTFYTNGANLSTGALTNTHLTNAIESKVSVIDAETINGVKTFGSFPVTPSSAPTTDYQVANKKYVDDNEVDGLWGDDGTDVTLITPRDVDLGDNTIDTKRLLQSNTGNSIFIGEDAGLNDDLSSNYNVFIGTSNGIDNTSGEFNVSIGAYSFYKNITGDWNVSLGVNSMLSNLSGTDNTAIGANTLSVNTTGNSNVGIGKQALNGNATGHFNTAVGNRAGMKIADGVTSNETSSYSLYLGFDSRASADGNTNEIVLGPNAIGNGSNTATIGDDNVTDVYINKDGGATVHAGQYRLSALNTAPASAAAAGTLGEIRVDANHIYVCTATDTWKRTALTTW